jgi:anti-sigma B factor antagonist
MVLSLSRRRDGETEIVTVAGDVDLLGVQQLEDVLAAAAVEAGNRVEVDVSQVAFIDSSGINALVKGRRLADTNGKAYEVGGVEGFVRHVFELTGVLKLLTGQAP